MMRVDKDIFECAKKICRFKLILIPVEGVPHSIDNFPTSMVKFRSHPLFLHRRLMFLESFEYLMLRVAFEGAKIREFTKKATTGNITFNCVKLSVQCFVIIPCWSRCTK